MELGDWEVYVEGVSTIDTIETLTGDAAWRQVTVLGDAGALTASKPTGGGTSIGDVAKVTGSAPTSMGAAQTGAATRTGAEVTTLVNAVAAVAAAAFAI